MAPPRRMSVHLEAAAGFVRQHGDPREREALRLLFEPSPPRPEIVSAILAGQRADGGWGYEERGPSSLNQTLWPLTQAMEVRLDANNPGIRSALDFIEQVQSPDGSWSEDPRLASVCPPWVAPKNRSAEIYLTASACYTLALLAGTSPCLDSGSAYLSSRLEDNGRLPSYFHAHWLAAGFWWKLGQREAAERTLGYLSSRLGPAFPTNNLSWAAVTLLDAGYPAGSPFLATVLDMLETRQAADGSFDSEDGIGAFPHATWEALKALQLSGRLIC